MDNKHFNLSLAAAILAPFFISLSIIITKMAGHVLHPLVIAGIGPLIAVPFLLLMQLPTKRSLDLIKILTELKRPFIQVLITRAILGSCLIISGFVLTTAVKAVLLLRLEPLFVFLWTVILYKEKPRLKKVLLLLLLLAGSALVVAPQNGTVDGPNLGDGLVVASLIFLSFSYFPTKEIANKANPAGLNLLTTLGGGLCITLGLIVFGHFDPLHIPLKGIEFITYYSIVFHVIAASLYFFAFKVLKPWIISSFLSLEVVFGLILAFLLLHESVTPLQLAGAAIVLGATVAIGRSGEI